MKRALLPVLFLFAIWGAVLLIPPLNLLFQVQVRGSAMQNFSALPPPQHSDVNFWEKAARRLPQQRDVLLQAALEYPVDESTLLAQEDDYVNDYAYPGASPVPEAPPGPHLVPGPDSQAFPGKTSADPYIEKLRRLDWLLQKYPQDKVLIAVRLRSTFSGMRNGRVGGEMSDSQLEANRAAGLPSPEVSKEKPNFSSADLQNAIALAARGQQLDPNNGFFDWIKCCFLIHAWRDAEAYQALDAAAQKKRFEDYSLAQQQTKLTALEAALGRKLLLEEKFQQNQTVTYEIFGRYREMARVLSWQSVKAQRRGDHQQALRLSAGLARVGARMRQNSATYLEALVASAVEAIGWGGPTYDARVARRLNQNQRNVSFQEYAKKHGRPELATEAANSYGATAALRNAISPRLANSAYGSSFWVFIVVALLWVAGVVVLLLLPLALLLPIILWLLSRVPRIRRVLAPRESDELPSRREVWNGALACGGFRALASAACGAVVVILCMAALMTGAGNGADIVQAIEDTWVSTVTQGGMFNGVEGVYYLLISSDEPASQWRYVLALSPLLFGALFAVWRAVERQKHWNGESTFSLRRFGKALFKGHAFRSPTGAHEEFDTAGAAMKLFGLFFMVLLFGSWLILAFLHTDNGSGSLLIPLFLVVVFTSSLLSEKFVEWRQRPRRKAAVRYGARLLQRSLLAWLLLGSALYLALLVISVPIRNRVEARVDRVLEVGELRSATGNVK